VVDTGFLEEPERSDDGEGEGAGQRFDLVVEVEEETLPIARLDEADGMAVELLLRLPALDVTEEDVGRRSISSGRPHRPLRWGR